MARRADALVQFDALALEGGLLPPEWLGKVAALGAPQQSEADYGVPRGLTLRDEIGRYWRIAGAVWHEFETARAQPHDPGAVSTHFVIQLLREVFGFTSLCEAAPREVAARVFPIGHAAFGGQVPVIVAPHDQSLDLAHPRQGDGTRRRSAFGLAQEYLNAADDALWGIAANGLSLRLVRDNASLTRPAWFEADLERIFTEDRYAEFSVLWLVLHQSRFGRPGQPPHDCPLEAWRAAGREEGSRARDALRGSVEAALLELGQGFLVNARLRERLAHGELSASAYFNQLLRLIYRLIFLLTIEERGLLHPPGTSAELAALYARGYGLRRLRERALRRSQYDRHTDLWASLVPVMRGLAVGDTRLGLPALGGLFAAEQCPDLDPSQLENRRLLAVVFHLAWLREDGALVRVNWKDMGPEELGSVYESLLELTPEVLAAGQTFRFAVGAATRGHARKLTGSYYTPDALVQQLLDTALEPVVEQCLAAHPEDPGSALLALAVIDPACGSGHFLLSAARRLAAHLARIRAGGTPSAAEYRHALRDVVTHCIHGVDRNPLALELARMALWLEAYTPERPLGFLDHHLVCGDALLGLLDFDALREGIPDAAFKALTGDDKDSCKLLAQRNRAGRRALEAAQRGQHSLDFGTTALSRAFAELDGAADVTLDDVAAKARRYAALHSEAVSGPLALAADLFLAAFLLPKTAASAQAVPTSAELVHLLQGNGEVAAPIMVAARRACADARVLHWPLAFPQVFARGGFDVVLGNPPWERMKLQEQEFFAARAPQVAEARHKAERERAIRLLEQAPAGSAERAIFDAFVHAKHEADATSAFMHAEARYPLTGVGDVNTYALFAESVYTITAPTGRAGLVLPTGIATDDSTKRLFHDVIRSGRLESYFGFKNERFIFPRPVEHTITFGLATFLGGSQESATTEFLWFAYTLPEIHDTRRRVSLTRDDFALLNPNTLTCPVFRSAFDAELTRKIYRRVPILLDESKLEADGNPWGIQFQRLFDMSTDSELFRDRPAQDAVSLYEAKMIHQFDHRWTTYAPGKASEYGAEASSEARDLKDHEKADPATGAHPRYWVERAEVEARLSAKGWTRDWLMGWRDICRSTDERTVIAAVVPRVGVGNNLPLVLFGPTDTPAPWAALLGNLNALVLDYVARHKVGGTHLNYFIYKQLPVLPPDRYTDADLAFIVPRVLELTYTANDLAGWARDLSHDGPPFAWDPPRRALLRAELDAWYARRYGLDRDELRYILDPADVMGEDYPSETFRVLKQRELREYGEYRTRRLVLEAWDRLCGGH